MPDEHATFQRLQAYVGQPYRTGAFDCADLAVQVQRDVFGRSVCLPQRRHPQGTAGQRAAILSLRDELAIPVAVPFTGAAVLLSDRTPSGADCWHIGTAAWHRGEIWVLHNSRQAGSVVLNRLKDLFRFGMRLDGYYAWK